MTHAEAIDELLDDPALPGHLEQLNRHWRQEAAARELFFRDIRDDQKAEFINGKVIMHSPSKYKHSLVVKRLARLLAAYADLRDLGQVLTEKTLIHLTRNDYEPDIAYFSRNKAALFEPNQMKFPAPDLIVEVLSESTERNDRGVKFIDYAAHGVSEYWMIDPDAQSIEQYQLQARAYILQAKHTSGIIKSSALPAFEIPATAIFNDQESLQALQRIILV